MPPAHEYRHRGQPLTVPDSTNLPGIGHFKCQSCQHVFTDDAPRHSHACGVEPSAPTIPGPPYGYSYRGRMSSPASSVDTHSAAPTPTSSRSPSVAGSADNESPADLADEPMCSKCGPGCRDRKHRKGMSKNRKEKMNRGDQGAMLQHSEDTFWCTFGWKPSKSQSAGNGNSSGLETPKVDLMRLEQLFGRRYLEGSLQAAIAAGREEAWKADMQRDSDAHLALCRASDGTTDPCFAGSWMQLPPGQAPCRELGGKGRGSKRCAVHPDSGLSHWECRKRQRMLVHEAGKAAFTRQCRRA